MEKKDEPDMLNRVNAEATHRYQGVEYESMNDMIQGALDRGCDPNYSYEYWTSHNNKWISSAPEELWDQITP